MIEERTETLLKTTFIYLQVRLHSLLLKLNLYDKKELFFLADKTWPAKANLPKRIEVNIGELNPIAFFLVNNEPLLLFFENPGDTTALEKKCWNFNQSPVIFIIEEQNLRILNGFNFVKNIGLEILSQNPEDFEYFKLITGKTWQKYQEKFDNRNRVDYKLLRNIDAARSVLIDVYNLNPKVANYLIGRIIFIRYLIDREVELKKYGIISKEDFYKILKSKQKAYAFFNTLKTDFNGNLFPLRYVIDSAEINERDLVNDEQLNIIIDLLKGNEIKEGQISLFDIYDFSIIPVEFVSNVYEKFIGKGEQAKHGAYYTPLFLVDYIQKNTVTKYFEENPTTYNCKVLDPACGSGIFLVETLRQIIYQYQRNNPKYKKDIVKYKQALKDLLANNIFGIDKDENAVSVAIFSLYITLLDYLEPSSIVDFQFPFLLNKNFFVADFFNLKDPYNNEFKSHHFLFVLGNPPWATKHPKEKQLFETYWENRQRSEGSEIKSSDREIAQSFLIRVNDFSFGDCAFIVTSKILYKIHGSTFRKYFLTNFLIKKVLELSSVRHLIFDKSNDKAVAPASILFYSASKTEESCRNNQVTHISLKSNIFFEVFKLLVIEKYDYKELQQKFLIDNDWLWKTLVYGNVLDFYFIKRLKESFKTIEDEISDKSRFLTGQGLNIGGGDENDASQYIGKVFVEPKQLSNYYLDIDDKKKWKLSTVHRNKADKPELFTAPLYLTKRGSDPDFKALGAIAYQDVVYTHSFFGIKALSKKDLPILKSILAIHNSDFFSYCLVMLASSIGIEREQIHVEEKLITPYTTSEKLIEWVSLAEKKAKEIYDQVLVDNSKKHELSILEKSIAFELYSSFNMSIQEISLIHYAHEISIPLIKGDCRTVTRQLQYEEKWIEKYIKIFIDHFNNIYNNKGNYFESEILYSEYTIGIYFKIIPKVSKFKNQIKWRRIEYNSFISLFTTLSFSQLSDNLFMQKDIKGFEKNGFYIIKPNELKCWHYALAYQDLNEIIDAIHKTAESNG